MTKNRFFLTFLVMIATVLAISATPNEIVVHSGNGNGYDLCHQDTWQSDY